MLNILLLKKSGVAKINGDSLKNIFLTLKNQQTLTLMINMEFLQIKSLKHIQPILKGH